MAIVIPLRCRSAEEVLAYILGMLEGQLGSQSGVKREAILAAAHTIAVYLDRPLTISEAP